MLFGPGSRALRDLVYELAPYLEKESGSLVDWVTFGDPRRGDEAVRARLSNCGIQLEELSAEWSASIETCADADDAVTRETAKLASVLGKTPEDMPMVILFVPGSDQEPIPIRLPRAAAHSPELARKALDVLRSKLSARACRALQKDLKPEDRDAWATKTAAEVVLQFGALSSDQELAALPPDVKKRTVIDMVEAGYDATKACDRVGISTQAVYQDPVYGDKLKAATEGKRRKHRAPRTGRVEDGRIEADSPGDDDGEDGTGDGTAK
jgi:hypothetical protein